MIASDYGVAAALSIEGYGARISVLTNDRRLLPRIRRRLPFGVALTDAGSADRILRLIAGADDYRLYVDDRLVRSSSHVSRVLRSVARQLQYAVARFARQYVFVHAGVVAWQGGAILMPGRSFSGKSMLVAALLECGARYMSDEFALIDEGGSIHPYPRPLRLRTAGARIRRPIPQPQSEALPLAAVVLTEFASGQYWCPRPANQIDAILGVLANTVSARDDPRRAFAVVRRAVRGAAVWAGPRGEATETAQMLLSAVTRRGAA